ncbi:tail-collar fiber protein [Kosakonia sp. AG348]|nr:tail-collar fiber protein [Kosakonia sp. AG348]
MSQKFYTLLTEIGVAKLASAAALGVPLKITRMAVGDGGGVLPTPSAQQTMLIAEKRRAALNMLYIDPQNSSQIIAEQVIPETEGGWWIREVGLFDETGALIAVGNCPESYKPQLAEGSGRTQTVRMILITSSTDNITLKIDPSVVLATRQYVDDKVIELKAYADDRLNKHIEAVDPHQQYAKKDSPVFSGAPTAPTPEAGDKSKKLATTEFVASTLATLAGSVPETLDTLKELAEALGNDPNFATTVLTQLSGKMDKSQNGADIPDPQLFLKNIGLPDVVPGRFLRRRFITASGNYKPGGDVKMIRVRVVGGGGGGGAAGQTSNGYTAIGGGGGAGGYSEQTLKVNTDFQVVNVTIGAGGVPGGQSGYSGCAGGLTSFGSICSATGGDGGAGTSATNNSSYIMSGGAGGLGSGGEINAYGAPGSAAIMPSVAQGESEAETTSNIIGGVRLTVKKRG